MNVFSKWNVFCLISFCMLAACDKNKEDEASKATVSSLGSGRYLYVASGTCYSGGGNTTFTNLTSSNVVYRLDVNSGEKISTVADYNKSPAQSGDSPVGIGSIDGNNLYILIENTSTTSVRRIERVAKSGGARTYFSTNITALSAQLRDFHLLSNGDMLVSKSTGVEKISSANIRLGAPYVNAPGGSCATSTTLISKVATLNNGNIVFLHAAASQNRFGIISSSGYAAAADCKAAQAAPNVASFPVAVVYDKINNKLIVAYAGNSLSSDINSIYAYSIDETANTISSPQKIYDSSQYPTTYPYLLYGISAMALDAQEETLYIATAVSANATVVNYAIEKLSYKPSLIGVTNSQVLSRSGNLPFYQYGWDTKCISAMTVSN